MGTNYLDIESYYRNPLLINLNLDGIRVISEIEGFMKSNYQNQSITFLNTKVVGNEITVEISVNQQLPFQFPFEFVRISALSSAKLVVE